MAVDLKALELIAQGEPSSKVTVTRRWLAEVHRLLSEGERLRAADAKRKELSGKFDGFFKGGGR